MWSYYGSKSKLIDLYPKPTESLIIEPFAGTARYALKYYERDVIINDKYEIVARIWKFLQSCSPNDILNLPNLQVGDKINRDDFDCIEMAWLMGFMIKQGGVTPDLTMSNWGSINYARSKKRIAENLFKIKHWKVLNLDYREIPNTKATWFIDSPYVNGGQKYKYSSKKLDFRLLGKWCQERTGQVIVCENTKADWLPFMPMKSMNGLRYSTVEAIWTNQHTHYHNIQTQLQLQ